MKAKEYQLMEECVMDGVARGFARAYKHTDSPSNDALQESIYQAVLSEIVEWFDFDFQNDSLGILK